MESLDRIEALEANLAVAREALKRADANIGWEMESPAVRAGIQSALKELDND